MNESPIRDKIAAAQAAGNAQSLLAILEAQLVSAQAQLTSAREIVRMLHRPAPTPEAEDHTPGAEIETLGGGSGRVEP